MRAAGIVNAPAFADTVKLSSSSGFYRTEAQMPFVNIKITREGATSAQKAELIKGVTDLLERVLAKPPSTTFVVIDEVNTEDWGIGGLTVDEYRKAMAAKK